MLTTAAPAAPSATGSPGPETRPEFFGDGLAVEPNQIARELKKLWQENDRGATRASRLNLVIYSAAEHSIRANTALVAQASRQHAFRAILVAAKPRDHGHRVRAWVNAHCQISRTGAKLRCSEQVAFQLEGPASDFALIPNIVFAHLDSDLPLYFWWQGELPEQPPEQLLRWIDWLLIDSADWTQPAAQFARLRRFGQVRPGLETALGDLNWTRLTDLRLALAQLFDAPPRRSLLTRIESVEVRHAPSARLQAMLLVGWLGGQLSWQAEPLTAADSAGPFAFRVPGSDQTVTVAFRAATPPAGLPADGGPAAATPVGGAGGVVSVRVRTRGGDELSVSRPEGSDFLNTCQRLAGQSQEECQVLPARASTLADLVSEELAHSAVHQTYRRAVASVEPWLPSLDTASDRPGSALPTR